MQNFNFHRPASVADAVAALRAADEGKVLGGGQSLLPVMKLNLAAPSDLVSLSGIPALKGIRVDGGCVVVGATTTHAEVAGSAEIQKAIPALASLAGTIGDPQVRNRGTLGGSVAHNDPAADYPAAVLALAATVVTDRREISADDYFQGMFQTALAEDEIITAVKFPIPDKAAYAKFSNPASKYAVVGVMVAKRGSDVRVAVTGAGEAVFRFAEAEKALAAKFSVGALDRVAYTRTDLIGDIHASAEYRAHLIGVMTKRAVAAAG